MRWAAVAIGLLVVAALAALVLSFLRKGPARSLVATVEKLEAGLRAPAASPMLSYGALKLFPFWDPLRGDPRFEKIVASLAPK